MFPEDLKTFLSYLAFIGALGMAYYFIRRRYPRISREDEEMINRLLNEMNPDYNELQNRRLAGDEVIARYGEPRKDGRIPDFNRKNDENDIRRRHSNLNSNNRPTNDNNSNRNAMDEQNMERIARLRETQMKSQLNAVLRELQQTKEEPKKVHSIKEIIQNNNKSPAKVFSIRTRDQFHPQKDPKVTMIKNLPNWMDDKCPESSTEGETESDLDSDSSLIKERDGVRVKVSYNLKQLDNHLTNKKGSLWSNVGKPYSIQRLDIRRPKSDLNPIIPTKSYTGVSPLNPMEMRRLPRNPYPSSYPKRLPNRVIKNREKRVPVQSFVSTITPLQVERGSKVEGNEGPVPVRNPKNKPLPMNQNLAAILDTLNSSAKKDANNLEQCHQLEKLALLEGGMTWKQIAMEELQQKRDCNKFMLIRKKAERMPQEEQRNTATVDEKKLGHFDDSLNENLEFNRKRDDNNEDDGGGGQAGGHLQQNRMKARIVRGVKGKGGQTPVQGVKRPKNK